MTQPNFNAVRWGRMWNGLPTGDFLKQNLLISAWGEAFNCSDSSDGYLDTVVEENEGYKITTHASGMNKTRYGGTRIPVNLSPVIGVESMITCTFHMKIDTGSHATIGFSSADFNLYSDTYYPKAVVGFRLGTGKLIINGAKTTSNQYKLFINEVTDTDVAVLGISPTVTNYSITSWNRFDIIVTFQPYTYAKVRVLLKINGQLVYNSAIIAFDATNNTLNDMLTYGVVPFMHFQTGSKNYWVSYSQITVS